MQILSKKQFFGFFSPKLSCYFRFFAILVPGKISPKQLCQIIQDCFIQSSFVSPLSTIFHCSIRNILCKITRFLYGFFLSTFRSIVKQKIRLPISYFLWHPWSTSLLPASTDASSTTRLISTRPKFQLATLQKNSPKKGLSEKNKFRN